MKTFATAALSLALSLTGVTALAGEAPTISNDAHALAMLHVANQGEIALGNLAATKAAAKAARDYATMLVTDHTQNDKDVMALADQLDLNLVAIVSDDAQAQKAQSDAKDQLQALQALSGGDFDRTFVKDGYDGHVQAITLFTQLRTQLADNSPVAKLIDQTMPTLIKHRDAAKAVLDQLSGQ